MGLSDLFRRKPNEDDMAQRAVIIDSAVRKIFELAKIKSFTNEYRVRAIAGFVLSEMCLLNVFPPPRGSTRNHIESLHSTGVKIANSFHVKPLKTFINGQEKENFLSYISNARNEITADTTINADFVLNILIEHYRASEAEAFRNQPQQSFIWASMSFAKITFGEKSEHVMSWMHGLPVFFMETTKRLADLRA
jgi:hypothetical protein